MAFNPGTPITSLEPIIELAERILVMTVNPGFAGQGYLDWVDRKIVQVLELTAGRGITVSVDGAISQDRITRLSALGVEGFILGTSALFTGHHGAAAHHTTLDRLHSS